MTRFLLPLLVATSASAVTYSTDAIVTAPAPTQSYIYREATPGNLVLDNTHPVTAALQGTAGAAGGNVELFATGDLDPLYLDPANGQPFSSVALVTLTGTANNAPFTLTSLNGTTWFTTTGGGGYSTAYGSVNLANTWFNDFVSNGIIPLLGGNALFINLLNSNRPALFNAFRDRGGFTELSDPNISHLYEDGGQFNIGLAGFIDQSPRLRVLLPEYAQLIPDGIQSSEVVMVNGVPKYSFSAVASGVTLNDDFQSYSGTYVITAPAIPVPEPAGVALSALAGLALLRRRR